MVHVINITVNFIRKHKQKSFTVSIKDSNFHVFLFSFFFFFETVSYIVNCLFQSFFCLVEHSGVAPS